MTYFAFGFDEEKEENIQFFTTGIGLYYGSDFALAYC